jgi:hypothetical protein
LCTLLSAGLAHVRQVQATHDKAFWRGIAKNHYDVPSGESASQLSQELSQLLGSPDPELRDDLAYSIFAHWIGRLSLLPQEILVALTDEWRGNLKSGIGETGTDSVLKRSFSALCLSLMAEREAQQPFLGESEYHALVADAVAYLQAERDLRGYDAKLGWIHATAHAADLLQALARSSLLSRDEQAAILSAIAQRLSSAPEVYIQGEQDRMAQAVLAIIRRADFDAHSFEIWLGALRDEDKNIWDNPLTPEILARYQNHTYMLQALAVRLVLEPESVRTSQYQKQVLAILRAR